MKFWKTKGFVFTEEMEDIKEEYKTTDRAKKIAEKRKEKK